MNNNEKWSPENAPNVKRDFEGQPPEKTGSPIATKWELERLIAERSNPVHRLDYLPDSQATAKLQEKMRQQRENRIETLEQLFDKYQNYARDDFNRNADDYLIKRDKQNKDRER